MAETPARRLLTDLYRAALEAVEPGRLVGAALEDPAVARALGAGRRVGVFAAGKAARAMARATSGALGRVPLLAVLPEGYPSRGLSGETLLAAHPEPDASSLRAARRALGFFRAFGPEDTLLCLISGGASSLLALPAAGRTLAAKRRLVRALQSSGASILAVNRLRVSLSAVKGGGLGRATPARIVTLVLSDVPGDRAAAVGSGPTVRGGTGDVTRVIGSNRLGLEAAERMARRRGLSVEKDRVRLSGEARRTGARLGLRAASLHAGTVLLGGGETTVALAGKTGRGGRCLELALAAAMELEAAGSGAVLLAAGSDGRDGNSGAAGAFADARAPSRARRLGFRPEDALSRHDTRSLFSAAGGLFVTGPTGTNVGDWVFGVGG